MLTTCFRTSGSLPESFELKLLSYKILEGTIHQNL